jgi:hypothetical protein
MPKAYCNVPSNTIGVINATNMTAVTLNLKKSIAINTPLSTPDSIPTHLQHKGNTKPHMWGARSGLRLHKGDLPKSFKRSFIFMRLLI